MQRRVPRPPRLSRDRRVQHLFGADPSAPGARHVAVSAAARRVGAARTFTAPSPGSWCRTRPPCDSIAAWASPTSVCSTSTRGKGTATSARCGCNVGCDGWADVELGGRHRGFRTVGRPDPDVDRRPPRTARPGGDHKVRWRSSTSMYASSSAITASVRRWPVNTSKASIAWPRNRSSPLIRCRPASAPRRKSVVSTGE